MGKETDDFLSKLSLVDVLSDNDPVPTPAPEPEPEPEPDKKPEPEPEPEPEPVKKPEPAGDPDAEPEPQEEGIIASLSAKLGYEIEGEFEESIEGIVDYTKKVAEEIAADQLSQVFQEYPVVEEFMRYMIQGGDPERFFAASNQEFDYAKMEIDEENEQLQKAVVTTLLKRQGFTDEEIRETVSNYENGDILYKMAKQSVKKLDELTRGEKQKLLKQQELESQARAKEQQKVWSDIQTTITKGDLKGFVVPEKEKTEFFRYLNAPVDKTGVTQRMKKREEMDMQTMLAIEYLLFKDFGLSKVVKKQAETLTVEKLKERLKSNTNKPPTANLSRQPKSPVRLPSSSEIF